MKKIICLLFLPLLACNSSQSNLNDLLKTDREFSDMCLNKGMAEAFVAYAADDVIKMHPYEFPIIGKSELKKMYEGSAENGVLKFGWEPVKYDIAASGDLAYTFGKWKIFIKGDSASNDTTIYGNYITIWKKQKDGTWKYVLDGGSSTPEPEVKQ